VTDSPRFKRVLVTGTAGFIGSHLSEALVAEGTEVIGVDCFTDYYPRALKEANLRRLSADRQFTLVEGDLTDLRLEPLMRNVDAVFHLAAQAGVRASWGDDFDLYVHHNVHGTQHVLEAARHRGVRVVYSSSSSIYGDAESFTTLESATPAPVSPYGATKLAGEHLCRIYSREMGVPTVSLRYFTVFGPRQRPDMAFTRFLRAACLGEPIELYGDGTQSRNFTYVADAVEANLRAAGFGTAGGVYNVGGGAQVSVNEVLEMLEDLTGAPIMVNRRERQPGDARHTGADGTLAERELGFRASTSLREGLGHQLAWVQASLDGQLSPAPHMLEAHREPTSTAA